MLSDSMRMHVFIKEPVLSKYHGVLTKHFHPRWINTDRHAKPCAQKALLICGERLATFAVWVDVGTRMTAAIYGWKQEDIFLLIIFNILCS